MTNHLTVAATREPQPKYFINVWLDGEGKTYSTGEVHTKRADAAKEAEEAFSFSDYYCTLTDIGRVDLTADFSNFYHECKEAAYSQMLNAQMRLEA